MATLPAIPTSLRPADIGRALASRPGMAVVLLMLALSLASATSAAAEDDNGQAATTQAKEAGIRAAQAALARARTLHPPAAFVPAQLHTGSTSLNISAVAVAVPANPAQVPRFSKVELQVTLSTTVAATKFYYPLPTSGGIALSCTFVGPTGVSWVIPGFYDGTTWRVRFAPDTIGTWQYTVAAQDPTGTAAALPGTFTVVASASRGWIQVAGNHLAHSADSSPFIGIGHNNGFLDAVETPLISAMPAIGENVLSFWLANPFGSANRNPIEATTPGGLGIYDQTACSTIDTLFADAETNGVYLLPSIWAHPQLYDGTNPSGWGTGDWSGNAYSTIIDPNTLVPITPQAFFTVVNSANVQTQQWIYQQNFYRYLIARWGYSTSLLGWVGMVEIEGTTSYYQNTAAGATWCTSVQGYFALNDPYRGSGSTAGTFPIGFSMSDQAGAGALSFDPGFSMRIIDSYVSQTNSVGVAATIASETLQLHASGKPTFTSEFGGEVNSTPPTAIEPLHFHNGIWAGIASGASLMPLKYCDGNAWPLITNTTDNYEAHIQEISRFLATVPYAGGAGLTSVTNTGSSAGGISSTVSGILVWGQTLSDRGFAWLQDPNVTPIGGNGSLSIANLTGGTYAVTWYDPWASSFTPLSSASIAVSGGTLTTPIPTGTKSDLAVRFQLQPIATAQMDSVVVGTSITITLAGTDGTGTLSGAAIASLPTNGVLHQTSDGVTIGAAITTAGTSVSSSSMQVIYTAGSIVGSDSFTFTVNDNGALSSTAAVSIQILPVNKPPVFTLPNPASVTVAENAPPSTFTNFLPTPSNGVGDVGSLTGFTVTIDQPTWFASPPAISLAGTLTFSVNANIEGTVHASVTLSNNGDNAGGGQGTSAAQTFVIIITHTPHLPTMADQTITDYPNYPVTITLAASVPDNATLAYAATSLPVHGSLTAVGGSLAALGSPPQLVYTAFAGYTGNDSFTVSATDVSLTANATIHITVLANATPTATPQQVTVIENQAVGIVLAGTDPDNQPLPLTFAIVNQPSHGAISGTPPGVTYTPAYGYIGSDSFTFTAFDGAATSSPQPVAISVVGGGSASPNTGGAGCGGGNGVAALVLVLLSLTSRRRWSRGPAP